MVYVVHHPKFREALAQELPWLGIGEKAKKDAGSKTTAENA